MPSSPALGHVAIIGGGIAGLASAHYASRSGARVTVLEASNQLGGLGTFFDYHGHPVERFYHCMLPSDRHLLSLLADLGLDQETYWKETSFGFMQQGRLYGLNTPAELLRFAPLSFIDRLRVGVTGVWGSLRPATGLDDMTCESWLTRLSGKRAFETFWKPMLQAKFGDRYRQVPALWFWTRFNREKGAKKERKGYLKGGYKHITDTLAQSLRTNGVDIRMNSPVQRIAFGDQNRPRIVDKDGNTQQFDRTIYAGPIARLGPLFDRDSTGNLAPPIAGKSLGENIEMQGVVNAVMMFKRGFTKHYWVAAVDPDVPFQGIVESTTLLDKSETGGHHLVYLMNYVHRTDPMFSRDDSDILADYFAGLKRMFPDLRDDDLVDAFVFRSPFVEPVYTVGYKRQQPPVSLVPNRVYLATTAQVYPQVTSWNGSTGLARSVVEQMCAHASQGEL